MMALTHVSREAYASLLEDGKQPLGVLQDRYGAGFILRLQGILCAMAVHQCAEDAEEEGFPAETAEELYELVQRFDYGSIFKDNGFERIKPSEGLLDPMLYSMCQAETEDWGDDE